MAWVLEQGDCLEVMRSDSPFMGEGTYDSLVSDPPSGTGFMGKDWDCFRRRHNPNDVDRPSVHGRMSAHAPHSYGESDRENFIAFMTEAMKESLRLLKPGAYALVWALPRTSHWTATAMENAGFEIRDVIVHAFGSGFPKSQDVGKFIDKMRNDDVRPVCRFLRAAMEYAQKTSKDIAGLFGYHSRMVDHWAARDTDSQPTVPTWEQWLTLRQALDFGDEMDAEVWRLNGRKGQPGEAYSEREVIGQGNAGLGKGRPAHEGGYKPTYALTTPATEEAKTWDGWGTALKPASEHWILARKPLSESSIARNVLKHGVGALNIDESRVDRAADDVPGWHTSGANGSAGYRAERCPNCVGGVPCETCQGTGFLKGTFVIRDMSAEEIQERCGNKGRWPTNLVLSHAPGCAEACEPDCPVAELDRQSGVRKSGMMKAGTKQQATTWCINSATPEVKADTYGDSGGASRFFPRFHYFAKPSRAEREAGLDALPDRTLNRVNPGGIEEDPRWAPVTVKNNHPTVKGKKLMAWLIQLITPPGGTVLDPFAGSGSTGVAAIENGFSFVGIEQDPDSYEIAEARIEHAVRETAARDGLFAEAGACPVG